MGGGKHALRAADCFGTTAGVLAGAISILTSMVHTR
jgi:hypothetical protein